ncbi:UNVERIFIED_CONTAM: hypothetical protein Scaly_3131700 [Sesamum calycinum]|uniref:Reverse transcriptase domain-containing protein n=1 Tax=Sesamum calycinum TaxID=2727403 RepID=A0AAW2JHA2_9LAMI
MDGSEVNGYAADTSNSMAEFQECVATSELIQLSYTGAPFTWHNCSEGGRSLWKRLDRMLVNEACVKDVWRHHIVGTSMYALTRKLKALKPVLRGIRKHQGDLSQNVTSAANFLSVAQRLNQEFQHDSVLMSLEKCCRIVYCKAVNLEVNMLQQRAKLSWLKGTRKTDQVDLTYLQPFAKHIISEAETEQIISPIQRQEIKDALFDIAEDSAPGPDGFSSGFFKASWSVIGEEVCKAVLEFFDNNRLLKQLNTTLLVLIPKVNMPTKVADFRPISCCNVIYKVITKIMVKRMQLVLDKLIDNTQNAFVPGRNIATNVLLAQELLAGYKQKKMPPRCTIKVDLQKAYDMVDWDYLLAVLRMFKFPDLHSVSVLKEGLLEFKELSGLQANAQKSQIIIPKLELNNYHKF